MTARVADEHAVAALASRDPELDGLATLLDPAALAALLDTEIRVSRVRYKPHTSVVVAFRHDGGHGWAACYASEHHVENTLRRAERSGGVAHRIPGMRHGVAGDLLGDRLLARPLREVDRAVPGIVADARVLRHNPHRRVVLDAHGHGIVKLTRAMTGPELALQRRIARSGIPLLSPTPITPHAWSTPRWGAGDLSHRPSTADALRAGVALASLHRVPPGRYAATVSLDDELTASTRGVGMLLPHLAARADALAARVPRFMAPDRLIHGDFSADQVLTGDGVRLIDLDRIVLGDPVRDLGSFVAEARLRDEDPAIAAALIDGYLDAGGIAHAEELRTWTAVCLLLRAAEPFRRGDPEWCTALERTLDLVEAELS